MKRSLTMLRKLEREFDARRKMRVGKLLVMRWSNEALPPEVPIGEDDRVVADFVVQFVAKGRSGYVVWVAGFERLTQDVGDHGMLYDARLIDAGAITKQTYRGFKRIGELAPDGFTDTLFAPLIRAAQTA